jgi:hypothetical protein
MLESHLDSSFRLSDLGDLSSLETLAREESDRSAGATMLLHESIPIVLGSFVGLGFDLGYHLTSPGIRAISFLLISISYDYEYIAE